MKKLFLIFFFFLSSLSAKSLILIISSDDLPVYKVQEASWKRYMNSMSDDFECYFIKEDENLDQIAKIVGNDLWIKNKMTYIPGLLEKTVYALKFLEERLDDFDHIVRTNLSSFYNLPALKAFLNNQPKQGLYSGVINSHLFPNFPSYVSGAGIYMTPDVCKVLISNSLEILEIKYQEVDDVIIGKFLNLKNISPISADRQDICNNNQLISFLMKLREHRCESIYHIRTKSDLESKRLSWETCVTNILHKIYYSN